MHGTFETIDGAPAVRFERRLAHPLEVVWEAVTRPEELAHWFPTTVAGDLRPGGRLEFTFPGADQAAMDGEVIALEPMRRFEFTWGPQRLRIDLEPADGGCVLRLTAFLSERDQAARDAAGWHVCLDALARHLAGEPAEGPSTEPTGEWREHYDEYARRGLPTGAPIPT